MPNDNANILRLVEVNAVEDAREEMASEFTDWLIAQSLAPETPLEAMLSPDLTATQRHWVIQFVRRWAGYAEGIRL